MKSASTFFCFIWLLVAGGLALSSFKGTANPSTKPPIFPYKKAGLTERQAAAHLLSRFTYGATPGQVEEVVNLGLEKWFASQLQATASTAPLDQRLARYETLQMTTKQIVQTFPPNGQALKMAIDDGVLDKKDINKDLVDKEARQEYQQKLQKYMQQKGFKPQRQLYQELINQKIVRAAYSENQLQEVMASFWFNHFNVSLTNRNCAPYLTSYERDVIRPNALGSFEALLLATAKSPAMLTYLDNYRSTTANPRLTPGQKQRQQRQLRMLENRQGRDTIMQMLQVAEQVKNAQKNQGLNENYAREIMELHTLGVAGGYTQQDVTEAARVLTGWTINPEIGRFNAKKAARLLSSQARVQALAKQGFIIDGDFLFAGNRHDNGTKNILNTSFPAGGGYEEGERLVKMLARHPSAARFICTKLATRFVNDTPPASLVDKMAKTFTQSNGDIKQVLQTLAASPEFWSKEALREKTKSPFELAISSVRSLNADVKAPFQLNSWITKMGERLYFYQAPTGFPDRGAYWINTGSLLNRMNFGLALANQKIPGVSIDLLALNQHREPESAEAALLTYSQYLLPERDLQETIKRLTPSLHDPHFNQKVNTAALQNQFQNPTDEIEQEDEMMEMAPRQKNGDTRPARKNMGKGAGNIKAKVNARDTSSPMLAQVVGTIIGSPEFQRR